MKLAYFPGCSAHGTGIEQDISTRAVCAALGIGLHELEDWNCCGSTAAHAIGDDLADSLGARNLDIAARSGLDLLVPCAACYANLTTAAARYTQGSDSVSVEDRMPNVVSLPSLLAREEFLQRIHKGRKLDLAHLKAVSYYGCLLVRHGGKVQEKDPENPMFIDRITEICGASVKDWSHKTTCCGGSLAISSPDLTGELSLDIVEHAVRAGANCVVTACPMCHMNLESQQWIKQHNKGRPPGSSEGLPVFYVTELVGLALGLPEISSCLKRHLIDPQSILRVRGVEHV